MKSYLLLFTYLLSFATFVNAQEQVDTLYSDLARADLFGKNIWAIGDVCSDDSEKGGRSLNDEAEMYSWSQFTHEDCGQDLYGLWLSSYRSINRCNTIIADVSASNQRKGEAHFIRALHHFYLVNIFGQLPIFTEPFDFEVNQQPFSSSAEVWALIENDLNFAISVLPSKSAYAATDKYRASAGAARALLSKAYLFQEKWMETKAIAEQIINSGEYALESNYTTNFSLEGEHGAESIFEIEQFDTSLGYTNAYDERDTHNKYLNPLHGSAFGYGFNCPSTNFHAEFEVGDPRLAATVFKDGDKIESSAGVFESLDVSQSPTGMFSKKYYLPAHLHNGDEFMPKNIKVIRYADILLMCAEANCQIGDMASSNMYLNMVRARSGMPEVQLFSITELLEAIRHERRVELGLEGHRFFDLQRYHRSGVINMQNTLVISNVDGAINFMEGKHELFPIPSHVLYTNPNAFQNPGYGSTQCIVTKPTTNFVVSSNILETNIDLVDLMTCPNNISLYGNSNESLVNTEILNNTLKITYPSNQTGIAEISIKGKCGIFPVVDNIHISIVETVQISEADAQVQETPDKTQSISISATVFDGKGLGSNVSYSATLADGSPLPSWITFDPATLTFTISSELKSGQKGINSLFRSGAAVTNLDLMVIAKDETDLTVAIEYAATIKGAPTQLDEQNPLEDIKVIPNPNNGFFKLGGKNHSGHLAIYNLSGQSVYESNDYKTLKWIDLSELPNNVYILRFQSKGYIWQGKFVKHD